MHIKISETGKLEFASLVTPLDIEIANDFFSEFPAFCWSYIEGEMVLKDDAQELKDVAIAEKAAIIEEKRLEQIKLTLIETVQKILDDGAKEKGYDSIISACSYVGSTNFGDEGRSFLDWRDAVWTYVYQLESDISDDTRTEPTIEEFIAELPVRILP